ncbi:MAG: branched-chain amino acid transaminase [Armatimonadetes bacterium]|nr:branched-chain amino acid transaminase [Armatimonadota bacterium]
MSDGANVWFNGKRVPWEAATVHVTTHALHYGSSVFEGIRAYDTAAGTAAFCLPQHIRRMLDSCKIYRMDIPYSAEVMAAATLDLIAANGHKSCYVRPLVFRGAGPIGVNPKKNPVDVVIFTIEWGRYLGADGIEKGVDVMVSSWRRMAPSTHPAMAKVGGNYVNSQFVTMEAAENGFTEGLALDVAGYVSEGAGENIFVIRDGVIHTPGLANSVLPGITRHVVMTLAHDLGFEVKETPIAREALYVADEVFMTGTAAEITPIRSIDRVTIGAGSRGPITARIQEEFFGITSGRIADRHGWLTFVPARAQTPA